MDVDYIKSRTPTSDRYQCLCMGLADIPPGNLVALVLGLPAMADRGLLTTGRVAPVSCMVAVKRPSPIRSISSLAISEIVTARL
jgi:hypothetical protein